MREDMTAMIELSVLSEYDKHGIEGIFNILKDEEETKKKAKERQGDEFNERHFEVARLVCNLDIISAALTMKKVIKNNDDLFFLGNKLIELGNELRGMK